MEPDYGVCTCKKSNDWCYGCGHERKWCNEACQRGMHGRCHPERNKDKK